MPLPVYSGPFGPRQAERLLWRAGFGPRRGEEAALARRGLDGAVAALTNPGTESLTGKPPKVDGHNLHPTDKFGDDHLWWLDRMVRTSRPLAERMTLVWHDWFATSNETVGSQRLMIRQNLLFLRVVVHLAVLADEARKLAPQIVGLRRRAACLSEKRIGIGREPAKRAECFLQQIPRYIPDVVRVEAEILGLDVPTLKNVRLSLRTLELLGFPPARTNLVLNRVSSDVGLSKEDVEVALGIPVAFEIPNDPVVAPAVNRGTVPALHESDSEFAHAIARVASSLQPALAAPARAADSSFAGATTRLHRFVPRRLLEGRA